jgi:hypothetical protein
MCGESPGQIKMMTVNRRFPSPHRLVFNVSPERRKYNGAMNGISRSEHTIGYYTEEIAERVAHGPYEDADMEENRLDDLKLFNNTIATHHRKIAEHHTILASIPAMME